MRMSMNEKKALYAFGCPNREATVERLRFVAALAPDPAAKKLFFTLAVKLSDECVVILQSMIPTHQDTIPIATSC